MHFEKWLRALTVTTLPEWREHYLGYKALKQSIKSLVHDRALGIDGGECMGSLTGNELVFIFLLNVELRKIGRFVKEKTNDYGTRLEILKYRIERMKTADGACKNSSSVREQVIQEMVNFHGELVLLENYILWNYIGLRKILKKYDRQVRPVLVQCYGEWVKGRPCFATAVLSKLITECHTIVQSLLFPPTNADQMTEVGTTDIFCNRNGHIIHTSSLAALEILNGMMKDSSA